MKKPPVKPVGRILYSQYIRPHWIRDYNNPPPDPTYERVCECKGFSNDRPFSVFVNTKPAKDEKPFKVVFHWTSSKSKSFKTKYCGEERTVTDDDTYHMMDVLEEHATKNAAQAAMRKYATAAFAAVNNPAAHGEVCHPKVGGGSKKVRVGDLVEYTSCPGIVWRVTGERRTNHDWSLQVEPVFSFLVRNGTNKSKEISERDAYNYVHVLDLLKLGPSLQELSTFLHEEVKRRS